MTDLRNRDAEARWPAYGAMLALLTATPAGDGRAGVVLGLAIAAIAVAMAAILDRRERDGTGDGRVAGAVLLGTLGVVLILALVVAAALA